MLNFFLVSAININKTHCVNFLKFLIQHTSFNRKEIYRKKYICICIIVYRLYYYYKDFGEAQRYRISISISDQFCRY